MRAIQEELGVAEDVEDEVAGFMEKLDSLELEEKTRDKVEKEINRFSKMQPSSAEANVSRNYIETILSLPWNTESEDNIDLNKAEEILNEDHYGLNKVKERVLEYLAVMQLSRGLKGPIPVSYTHLWKGFAEITEGDSLRRYIHDEHHSDRYK